MRFKEAKLEYLILGTLLAYVTLHLLEEGIFGFPAWAQHRWGIPNYTVTRWLIHNGYFTFFLVAGYFVFRADKERFLPAGLGILIWGLLNSLNHIAFSALFLEYSPGLVTGLVFLAFAVLGLRKVREMGKLSRGLILLSILSGFSYWGLPMLSFISVDIMLGV